MTKGLKGHHVKIFFSGKKKPIQGVVKEASDSLILIAARVNDDRREKFVRGDRLISLTAGSFELLEVLC